MLSSGIVATVFHFVPEPLHGSTLHPLHELERIAPEAWRAAIAKYEGREQVLAATIPVLGCRWNDALHLATVPPETIAELLGAVGLEPLRRRAFEIDTESFDPAHAVVFLNRRAGGVDPFADAAQWLPLDDALIESLREANDETRAYYAECAAAGRRPRLYGHLPHVLYRGSVDVAGCRVREV